MNKLLSILMPLIILNFLNISFSMKPLESILDNKSIYSIINANDRKWHRITKDSLFYFGEIDHETKTNFFKTVGPEIKNIYIESPGGSVDAGLDIGLYIANHNINVAPRRFCLSSCANYIFLAAKEKIIPQGSLVGFHGNSHTVKDDKNASWAIDMNKRENIFLHKIRLPQKFFDCSVSFVLANDAHMWIPLPKDYARYNIKSLHYQYSPNRKDYPSIENTDKFTYQNTSKAWEEQCGT